MDTLKFTLAQAKTHFGSTGTERSLFSSLMTLNRVLSAKHGSDFWTVILSNFQSREGSEALDTMSSACVPTSGQSTPGHLLSGDESADASGSEEDEEGMETYGTGSEEDASDYDLEATSSQGDVHFRSRAPPRQEDWHGRAKRSRFIDDEATQNY